MRTRRFQRFRRYTKKKCLMCGRMFKASRVDARYCSSKCRKRASRGDTPQWWNLPGVDA